MEIILQFIGELLLDAIGEGAKSSKIPKPLRFILIGIIALVYAAAIGLIAFVGASMLDENAAGGIIIMLFALIILVMTVIRFKKTIKDKKEEMEMNKNDL